MAIVSDKHFRRHVRRSVSVVGETFRRYFGQMPFVINTQLGQIDVLPPANAHRPTSLRRG